jgi:Polyketide cyclase / dehydrase and lipid transport
LIWRYHINKRIIIASALAAVATTAMILPHQEIAMVKMESTVTIARSVEEVFRFFLDLDRNARTTDPNVESVTKTPEGPTRPGTTFLFRQRALGAMRETATTFVSIEPNRKIEIDARLGPLRPRGAIGFDQTNLGTTVTVRLNPNPIGPLKLLSPVFTRIGEMVWDKRLARLKDALERSPESQLIDHQRPAAR